MSPRYGSARPGLLGFSHDCGSDTCASPPCRDGLAYTLINFMWAGEVDEKKGLVNVLWSSILWGEFQAEVMWLGRGVSKA